MVHAFQENLAIANRSLRLDSGYSGDVNRTGDGWGDANNSFVMGIRTGDGVGESVEVSDIISCFGDGEGCGVGILADGDGRGEGV